MKTTNVIQHEGNNNTFIKKHLFQKSNYYLQSVTRNVRF